jgi:hypothetical protein
MSFSFSFTKLENKSVKQVSFGGKGWYWWEEGRAEERHGRVNIVQILCEPLCKWKYDIC